MLHHSPHPALHAHPRLTGLNPGHSRLDLAAAAAASTESMEEPVTRITTTLEAPGLAPWTWDVM